jgi:iron(III) transport system ATP-binding protein
MAGDAAAVEFRTVTKRYGSIIAVDNISFTVEPGTLATLLGPSGCGKTTTLRLIAGLETVSDGQVLLGGLDVTRLSASERNVSLVFQSYALFPHMTVLENVAYGPSVSGVPKAHAEAMATDKLALVGLSGVDRRYPSELSGGQQQRVAVARALVLEPLVLAFDEPLSNLDAKLRRRVRDEIRELQSRLGLTVVYVTHDQQEALAISDQIIVMSEAKIAQRGTARELYEAPANLFVADFIGDANVVDAELTTVAGERGCVRVAGIQLALPHRNLVSGAVRLAIRPEALRLSLERASGPTITARVVKSVYLGSHIEYTLDSQLGRLLAIDRATEPYSTGVELFIGFAESGLTLLPR